MSVIFKKRNVNKQHTKSKQTTKICKQIADKDQKCKQTAEKCKQSENDNNGAPECTRSERWLHSKENLGNMKTRKQGRQCALQQMSNEGVCDSEQMDLSDD